jgi:hypothetical protein
MPIYALDGVSPDLPAAEQFWIAPDAQLDWRRDTRWNGRDHTERGSHWRRLSDPSKPFGG